MSTIMEEWGRIERQLDELKKLSNYAHQSMVEDVPLKDLADEQAEADKFGPLTTEDEQPVEVPNGPDDFDLIDPNE